MRYLKTVPQHVIDSYESMSWDGWHHERAPAIALRLLTDDRMRGAWEKLGNNYDRDGLFCLSKAHWGDYFFRAAVGRFGQAVSPDQWDTMTRAEQKRWFEKLDTMASEFTKHIAMGPSPPTGLPAGSDCIASVLTDLGVEIDYEHSPYTKGPDGSLTRPPTTPGTVRYTALMRAVGKADWTLIDAIHSFTRSQHRAVNDELQWHNKPRDGKADRARFIYLLSGDCHNYYGQAMQELVSVTAEVVFDDPAINVRLVRRVTTGK